MKTVLAALLAASISTVAHAGTVVFDFGLPSGPLGNTHTYIDDGLKIVASGFNQHGAPTDLWGKNAGGDEVGLGLKNDPTGDHEIAFGMGFVQLNVSGLFGKVKPNSTFFSTGSTTNDEEWGVYGSNLNDHLGKFLISGTTESSQALPYLGNYKYYNFVELSKPKNQGDNFLIASVTVSPSVPEPATWALMLIGVAGIGAALRGRRLELRAPGASPI